LKFANKKISGKAITFLYWSVNSDMQISIMAPI